MSQQRQPESDSFGLLNAASRVQDVEVQREELLLQMQLVISPELERRIAIALASMRVESTPALEFVTTGTTYANA